MACVKLGHNQLPAHGAADGNATARCKNGGQWSALRAPYESKAAYFATLDAILRDRELIEYHEDTAQIRL